MEKTEKSGNYALGLVGALLGGIVGTLPWILCYVYANMMYSILTVCIPIAAFMGFKLLQGKPDKKLPIFISVISFVAITVATLIVIPYLLLLKEYGQANLEMLKVLYGLSEFKTAIMHDYVFSLLFTVLGAGAIISNIKRSIDAGDEKVSFRAAPVFEPSKEDMDAVKEVFIKRQATNKENTISKSDLMSEIAGKENVLKYMISRGVIIRKKDQYYYVEK